MEWQNCPFWQTVFAGPQAHGADDGCSALQDIAGGLGLATCRPFASAKPTDMAIARKAIAKVFSIISSSLDDAYSPTKWTKRSVTERRFRRPGLSRNYRRSLSLLPPTQASMSAIAVVSVAVVCLRIFLAHSHCRHGRNGVPHAQWRKHAHS